MKLIEMNVATLGNNGWHDDGTRMFKRVSRWIKVKTNYNPNTRNALWDYVTDSCGYKPYNDEFNPEHGLYLDYFIWNGRTYAIEQFLSLGNKFYNPVTYSYLEDGKRLYLCGVDSENIYHPIYIERDNYGEYVRIYEEL